jgi:hypothetical protein
MFAAQVRKRRVASRKFSNWTWHLDEVFVKINGKLHYLWRAVDHEGEVLESYVARRRDCMAVLRFLRKAMKRYGNPKVVVTDHLKSQKGGDEGHRQCRPPGGRPLTQQPGGEFPPAVPAKGARDGQVSKLRDAPEIRPQSLQPRTSPEPQKNTQTKPIHRSGRMAPTRRLS